MKKHSNILMAALVFAAGGFATHATAGSCDNGIALFNPLTNQVEIDGIAIDGRIANVEIEIASNGLLPVRRFDFPPLAGNNPSNRFNPDTGQVELDCVVINENTFSATLDVVQDGNGSFFLEVADANNVFDIDRSDWNVNYDNDAPDELLTFRPPNRAALAGRLGISEIGKIDNDSVGPGFFIISIPVNEFSTTTLTGTARVVGELSGTFDRLQIFGDTILILLPVNFFLG